YYTALLHHVGCVGYARETAELFGDELVANVAAGRTDAASLRDLFATFLPLLMQGRPPLERARLVFTPPPRPPARRSVCLATPSAATSPSAPPCSPRISASSCSTRAGRSRTPRTAASRRR